MRFDRDKPAASAAATSSTSPCANLKLALPSFFSNKYSLPYQTQKLADVTYFSSPLSLHVCRFTHHHFCHQLRIHLGSQHCHYHHHHHHHLRRYQNFLHQLFLFSQLTLRAEHNLRRIIPIIVLAFGIGLVYFGILLGVGNLGFDTYVGTILNAVIEIPAFVIALYLTMEGKYYSRRGSLLAGFCMVSGAMSVTCTFAPAGSGRLVVELGAFVMGCVACNVMAICTTQPFKVKVRNTTVGVMWEAMTLAGVLAPVFVKQQANGFLSYGIFGILIMVCGLFAIMLPSEEVVTSATATTITSSPSQF